MRLNDKVAIVTGASSDIGKGIVKRFAEEGAKVVLVARNLEALEKTRKEGCTLGDVKHLLNKLTLHGSVPEPIRVSQLLAKTLLPK